MSENLNLLILKYHCERNVFVRVVVVKKNFERKFFSFPISLFFFQTKYIILTFSIWIDQAKELGVLHGEIY